MRNILYVTGTRADFGLMRSTLKRIDQSKELGLSIAITGMHLSEKHGYTAREVEDSGFATDRVSEFLDDGSRMSMCKSMSAQLDEFANLFTKKKPDLILLLGDRGEMLAAAITALYLNIPIAHIHGGERSGTIDESIRHAISKLAHFHFVSTGVSRERLIKMGEQADKIWCTGAPGLDDILSIVTLPKREFFTQYKLDIALPLVTIIFHPVVQDAEKAREQIAVLLAGVPENLQLFVLLPNADAGGESIKQGIEKFNFSCHEKVIIKDHLNRNEYLSLISASDVLVGNSSSGIIEAASFGTWVVNVGDRQAARERNSNTHDVELDSSEIRYAIQAKLKEKNKSTLNVYGDGNAGEQIVQLLETLEINEQTTKKGNTY